MRARGPYGDQNRALMTAFKKWADKEGLMQKQTSIYGIARDNPDTVDPQDCRYDCCIPVTDEFIIKNKNIINGDKKTEDVHSAFLEGGKYAVFEIDHTAEALQEAWNVIFDKLKEKNLTYDTSRPILERYREEIVAVHACELCVPIL
ncbi:GyrI-like domain-containing protein [Aduncisulcus paluster]|uniref:GyrI-like domain-containing protein n=1 Tax=Aduncisulcus paluster TaxID=2918883 RepID=A0ABQ5K3V3_9EUKA|nr:GyrI-like domain-containing protein [Aduncisulcus paluster]